MLTAMFSPLQALEGANAEARIEVSISVHPFDIRQRSRHFLLCTNHHHLVWLSRRPLCCGVFDALTRQHCDGVNAHQRAAQLFET